VSAVSSAVAGVRRVILVAGAAGAISGCGAMTTVGNGQPLSMALTEYRVIPQQARAPGGLLTIDVHNNGRFSHDLVISRDGVVVAQTPPLAPGAGIELTAVLAPGTYVMASTVLSDQALGAYGTLKIGS
jgi:hypothetical protein